MNKHHYLKGNPSIVNSHEPSKKKIKMSFGHHKSRESGVISQGRREAKKRVSDQTKTLILVAKSPKRVGFTPTRENKRPALDNPRICYSHIPRLIPKSSSSGRRE